jgi:hypothetical protein
VLICCCPEAVSIEILQRVLKPEESSTLLKKRGVFRKAIRVGNINSKNMVTVIISHECKNYSDWRKVFDADEVNRSKAGFKSTGVYHSVDNANKITIIGEAPSVAAINGFMANPKLKEAMDLGGVIGKPDVKILSRT